MSITNRLSKNRFVFAFVILLCVVGAYVGGAYALRTTNPENGDVTYSVKGGVGGVFAAAFVAFLLHRRFASPDKTPDTTPSGEKKTPSGPCPGGAQTNADGCCAPAIDLGCGCGQLAPDAKGCCQGQTIPDGDCDCLGNKQDADGCCAPDTDLGCGCGAPEPDAKGCCPDDQIPEGHCDCLGTLAEDGCCDGTTPASGYCDCAGTAEVDGCCNGETKDCKGECGGSAVMMDCGCNEPLNEHGCCGDETKDCMEECGGTAKDVGCGCGVPLNEHGCCGEVVKDCNEECGGTAVDLGCGCGEPLNEHGCCGEQTKDCKGECGGSAEDVGCGCGEPLNDDGCCGELVKDCNDECGGTAEDLGCGCGNALNLENCDGTCTGERPGMIYMDKCVCEYTKAGATAPIAYANAKTGEIVEMIAEDAGDLVGKQCKNTACPSSWTMGETEYTKAWDASTLFPQCEWNEDCVGEIKMNYTCRSPPAPSS